MISEAATVITQDGGKVVEVGYWDQRWSGREPLKYSAPPPWHTTVARFLPRRTDWTLLEIGCIPGGMLVYFHKEFGYLPAGLDYVDQLDQVRATLAANDCPEAELFRADLFTFEPPRQFDVVFSNGFVEHFEDYMPAIRKHDEALKPGGYLVITVPNYTHLQYYLHAVFDGPNLRNHRFEIMKPRVLRQAVESCGLEVLYCRPVTTFDFWVVHRGGGLRRFLARACEGAADRVQRGLQLLHLNDLPNVWLSPNVLCVARKPD